MNDYYQLLKANRIRIAVWGIGYIGLSTLAYFAREGVFSVGYDVDIRKVELVREGINPIFEVGEWLGFDIQRLIENGTISAVKDYKDFISLRAAVHFICVPTEKYGKPHFDALKDVIEKIVEISKNATDSPVIIVESTLFAGVTDEIVLPLIRDSGLTIGEDIFLGVAPRRDWFMHYDEKAQNIDYDESTQIITDSFTPDALRNLARIYAGANEASTKAVKEILSIVCDNLYRASSIRIAELTKSVENSFRHVQITLANQLAFAYPYDDTREVLQLASTKPGMGLFYPGLGTGGYCIPVSSEYVLEGANFSNELTILSTTVDTDAEINPRIALSLVRDGVKKVCIFGLSYKPDLKICILSPTIPLVKTLEENGLYAAVYDPLFNPQEIRDIGLIPVPSLIDLYEFDTIIVAVKHKIFQYQTQEFIEQLANCTRILDNNGTWQKWKLEFEKRGISYHIIGSPNWLHHKKSS